MLDKKTMDILNKIKDEETKKIFIAEFEKQEISHQETVKRHNQIMKKIDNLQRVY